MTVDVETALKSVVALRRTDVGTEGASLSGVYLVGHERLAVIPVEQAATMVGAAEFIEAQGRGMREDRLAAMLAFATRLREAMDVAKSSAVRLDIEPQAEGIAAFLLTQARARAALTDRTRQRHSCSTCGKSWITNPDYEETLEKRRRLDTVLSSGGAALFSGGVSTFVTTRLIFAFRKANPVRSCPHCQAMTTEQSVVVFCPACKSLYDKAILKQCSCGYDFVKDVDVRDVWRPLAESTIPAPAGDKLIEFQLDDEPTFIAFDDGGRMLTASQARSVQLWNLSSEGDRPECLWRASAGGIVKLNKPIVAFSPSGAWVATGKPMSRSFRLLRAADGTEAGRIDWAIVDGAGPYALAFAPDNDAVAVSYDNIDVFPLSDAGLGPRITRLKAGFWNSFGSLAFSPEGKRLAAAGGKALFLWRRDDWSQEGKIPVQGGIAGLAWSPTTPDLIALAVGPIARLVEVPSGHEVRDFRHDATVIGVAFSPDGALLATASVDQSARVFDVRDGGEVARISRPAAVTAVAFASDGRLAVGDAANRVQLWTPP